MSNDTKQSDKTEGEKLTLEEATSLVNGYANLTAMWVQEARRHERCTDFGEQDHSEAYLETLGEIVGEVWELWNRTTHRYPILRPVVRRVGADMLNSLQSAVVNDETLDDDWDIQKVICWTRCNMEERMSLPPWRECKGKEGERCRHSNDYEDDAAEWKCYHCDDRHADEAKEAEPAEVPSETEKDNEIPIDSCLYDVSIECSGHYRYFDVSDEERERIKKEVCTKCRDGKCVIMDDVICPKGSYGASNCGDCELRPRSPAQEYFAMQAQRVREARKAQGWSEEPE